MKIYLAGAVAKLEDEKRIFRMCKRKLISYASTFPGRIDQKTTLMNFKWMRGRD